MKSLSATPNKTLLGIRRTTRLLELLSGEEVVGSLKFEKVLGSLATAKAANGKWTVWRIGFPKPRTFVRSGNSKRNLAVLEPGPRQTATLQFSADRVFAWQPTQTRHEMAFLNGSGKPLVRFRPEGTGKSFQVTVEIEPGAHKLPELSILLLVGCYALISQQNDKIAPKPAPEKPAEGSPEAEPAGQPAAAEAT